MTRQSLVAHLIHETVYFLRIEGLSRLYIIFEIFDGHNIIVVLQSLYFHAYIAADAQGVDPVAVDAAYFNQVALCDSFCRKWPRYPTAHKS